MNKIILIGRLTKDPERIQANDKTLCKFGLATNANYTKDGERPVDYHTIIVWNSQAENCLKYLKKGSLVGLIGALQTRSYEKNGEKKYVTEVVASEIEFLSTSKQEEKGGSKETGKNETKKFEPVNDENLPF